MLRTYLNDETILYFVYFHGNNGYKKKKIDHLQFLHENVQYLCNIAGLITTYSYHTYLINNISHIEKKYLIKNNC